MSTGQAGAEGSGRAEVGGAWLTFFILRSLEAWDSVSE